MQAVGAPRRIDRSLPVPLHFQIRALLIEMIERGEVTSGEPFPPERQLAARYEVSLTPIRQAILDLVKEGVLYRRPGSGTFLREAPRTERVSVLSSFSESLRARGAQVDVVVLAQERMRTPRAIVDVVGHANDVVVIERLTVIDGEPAAVLRSSLPADRFPGLEHAQLPHGSLYRYLEDDAGVVPMRAETTVQVVPCSTVRSEQLRVAAGAPLLQASGAVYDGSDDVIEAFEVQYRSDAVRLRFDTLQTAEDVVDGRARAP
jgi:GntR family transcriptional regulator, N-acetylglucosamine utilization regulator